MFLSTNIAEWSFASWRRSWPWPKNAASPGGPPGSFSPNQAFRPPSASLSGNCALSCSVRTTRHVDLTPAGQALLREARRTLASARAATDAVAAVEGLRHGAVALGTMQASSFIDLPALLIRYRDAYPGIEFKLQQASAAELGRMLQDHILDLIFTTQANETPAEILSMPLVQSPVIVACQPTIPRGQENDRTQAAR